MQATFVTIEGIDGSGKATQADMLVSRFCHEQADKPQEEKERAAVVRFPRYTETYFGKLVREYLQGSFGGLNDNHPLLVSLLYALDRQESYTLLTSLLSLQGLVVADRYVDSNLAHQGAKLSGNAVVTLLQQISHIEYRLFHLPRPDVTILLDLPPMVAARRVAAERGAEGAEADIHESNVRYLTSVSRVYHDLASDHPASRQPWHVIPCVSEEQEPYSAAQIHERIWEVVKKL